MPEINGIIVPFLPAEVNRTSNQKPGIQHKPDVTFDKVFDEELQKIKFSGHAKSRMASRAMDLSEADILRLESAVDKAKTKGANESLVLLDDKAFIVSVDNSTVITVVNTKNLQENIVTNIDSAVFA